ncbi:MAG: sigma-70 family RNA polymerase sigma factor [Verrucomicrobiales bacterium]|nr:sigma-70 family RNA polymerase sigma factor [Verrucomicrobiales bacterium]
MAGSESEKTDPDSEFVSLLTDHQSALRLYVASLLPGEPAAADVAQQANATIWKKREDFAIGTNFKAWIFAIARFEVLNFRKKQAKDARRLVFSDELEEIIVEELPRLANDLDDRQHALRGCLENLKSADRDLILHRYFRRKPLKEFAAESGRTVGSLKVTLHRIRGKLANCIEGKLAMKGVGG